MKTAIASLLIVALCSSCAPVRPWERGQLAHGCMQAPVDGWEAGQYRHVEAVREGSAGGAGEGGGGCGCN